jgi:hypothetical protein
MRSANLFAALASVWVASVWMAGVLAATLPVLTTPATAAPIASVPAPPVEWGVNETPMTFSLRHVAPRVTRSFPVLHRPASPRPARLFGYPSANADELPSPAPAAPVLMFTHAALGVAMLDTPAAGPSGDATAGADTGHFDAAQLNLTMPAPPSPSFPSPLPIGLLVALVVLPGGLLLGQALFGPSRRPRMALRRHVAPRRDDEA